MVVKNSGDRQLYSCVLFFLALGLVPIAHLLDIYTMSWIFLLYLVSAVVVVYLEHPSLSNWMFWFQVTGFIMFGLSTVFYCLGVYDENELFPYDTTFFSQISIASYNKAMALVATAVTFLAILYQFDLSARRLAFPEHNARIEKVGILLIIITLPQCFLVGYFNISLSSSIGYAALYSVESRAYESPVPFSNVFTSLNLLGFMLFFASMPKERKYIQFAIIFLLLRLVESMTGARGLFVLPLFASVWLWAAMYDKHQIKMLRVFVYAVAIWTFSTLITLFRDGYGWEHFFNVYRGVSSVSKGLEMVAIYIEYSELVEHRGVFFIEPLLFPIKYFQTLGGVVGQSEVSAALRNELGHSLASELNYDAYMAGAGLGSSYVAEAYQYGIFWFPVFLFIFYILYRTFFIRLRSRFLLAFALPVFQHFVFTPRDTSLPNSYLFVKYGIFVALCIWLFGDDEGNPDYAIKHSDLRTGELRD